MKCRICETDCKMFLDLGRQPIANNFLTPDKFDNEVFYQLEVYFCPGCFTVQIGDCPSGPDVFNENYSFFTGTSKAMTKHFADLASLIKQKYLNGGGIIEIGSNDGTLLKHFKDYPHIGFDPSDSVNEVARSKGVNVASMPFEKYNGNVTADVIVSANAFAHIPDRQGVLKNIKRLLSQGGVWIDEEPYLGNIMETMAYDQFYNEHVFYTSIASMRNALLMYGLDIMGHEFIWTHGGSIRYFIGHEEIINRNGERLVVDIIKSEGLDDICVFNSFAMLVEGQAANFKQDLIELGKPVVGYAASAKSTTLLNYCQIGPDIISKIYDTTPEKQGKFSPGMHIPIAPYKQFKKDNPSDVVLFVPNHATEVFEKEAGVKRNWIIPNKGERG